MGDVSHETIVVELPPEDEDQEFMVYAHYDMIADGPNQT